MDLKENESSGFGTTADTGCLYQGSEISLGAGCASLAQWAYIRQSADIERVQRVAVHIILSDFTTGKSQYSYDMSLVVLDIEPLAIRRDKLCLTFAKKTVNSRHRDMFEKMMELK